MCTVDWMSIQFEIYIWCNSQYIKVGKAYWKTITKAIIKCVVFHIATTVINHNIFEGHTSSRDGSDNQEVGAKK